MQHEIGGLKSVDRFCSDHDLSRSTFYRMLKSGAIKAVRVGGATRIKPEHEREWLDSLPVITSEAA